MTPGIYSTVSALTARWSQQEKIAENISGSSTVAHKRQIVGYGSFNKVLHTAGGAQESVAEPLPYAQAPRSDWTLGPTRQTGGKLDASITGNGFFQVQTPAGVRLTRDGHFSVNSDKQLVNDAGYPVLGTHGPIKVSGDAALDSDGSVVVNGKSVERLSIVTVDRMENLQTLGGGLFAAAAPNTKPYAGTIAPGTLEMSNVDIPTEMNSMIQNQRMYDMLTRVFQTQDESIGKAIQDLTGS